jgi:hypothetical protein
MPNWKYYLFRRETVIPSNTDMQWKTNKYNTVRTNSNIKIIEEQNRYIIYAKSIKALPLHKPSLSKA